MRIPDPEGRADMRPDPARRMTEPRLKPCDQRRFLIRRHPRLPALPAVPANRPGRLRHGSRTDTAGASRAAYCRPDTNLANPHQDFPSSSSKSAFARRAIP